MNRDDVQSRLVLFGVIVVVTVAAVAAAGIVTNQGSTDRPSVDHAHFQPETVEGHDLERGGEITVDAAGSQTVLIDAAHANDISKADLQPVVSALTASGHTVEYLDPPNQDPNAPAEEREQALSDALEGADAFVVVEPEIRYTPGEADAVSDFAGGDGRVLFAGGPDTAGDTLLAPTTQPAGTSTPTDNGEFASVTSQFAIGYDTGYVYDMESDNNYRTIEATPDAESPLTEGVDSVVFDTPTQVATAGQSLLTTSASAEHSESREAGVYPVAVENDDAVAVGDVGFMTSEHYNRADNEAFIGNLLEFLVGAETAPAGTPTDDTGADTAVDEEIPDELADELDEADGDGSADDATTDADEESVDDSQEETD
ncbi:hypothetical protein D8Y22_00730 [Salinadaptatus halalkaliphilus]|uniref:DUF4350 domain-containing protein n=1 Tax=Salinadaptatus halalkaliphilus TaxID=2419781 RepID=A0A4S3TQK8_9EURY|nr:DUF4350 domain-containing protein [Salinadaptatus halalkaliphilus]THE66689.1 hypothetical protein D8Y22_00730 [Salinadaptatus halalkaliphilus]